MRIRARRLGLPAALVAAAAVATALPALPRGDDPVPPPAEPPPTAPLGVITNEPTVEYVPGQLVVGIADGASRTEVHAAR